MCHISVSETARRLISLYTLIICRSCLGTLNSHTFKFKWLHWQWEREDNKNTEALQWVQAMQ